MTRPGTPRRLLAALHPRAPDEAVVRLHGDLGPGDARRLEHRLRHALHRRSGLLVVDLAGVDSVSASAAWALAADLRAALEARTPTVIRGASPAVRQVLHRHGLDHLTTHQNRPRQRTL
ncbi:STAS domain-containing protein [Kitasatospora cineracea]|uniref:STAS domain-containing protein n=1 Tax=Kitasatospora cineracea TaxID=88074 RepID=UPI00379F9BF2